ncbi:hypothetical protein [Niastella koreensis]|uniref:hypothetical protein n=1 Tax=Niastella koreensis TaxID=354356 RepID=UPI0002E6188A|nr:hypothetical protein [Niastella koreensis]
MWVVYLTYVIILQPSIHIPVHHIIMLCKSPIEPGHHQMIFAPCTIVIHELGHNQGLPHCPTKNCIMNDANERIQTVDQSANTYCSVCKGKL